MLSEEEVTLVFHACRCRVGGELQGEEGTRGVGWGAAGCLASCCSFGHTP